MSILALDPSLTAEEVAALIPGAYVDTLPTELLNADPADTWPTLYGDHPPLEWLTTLPEGYGPDSPPYVDELGRVAAVAWPYDRCHVGYTDIGECWLPEPSPTGNHLFHQGVTTSAEGISVPTGFLCVTGHDTDPSSTIQQAQLLYADPRNAGARGRILETPEAAYYVGALVPGLTVKQVEQIRGGALSGDWRWSPETNSYDAIGPCLVARPGLPTMQQASAMVQASAGRVVAWELQPRVTAAAEGGTMVTAHQWAPITDLELTTMPTTRRRLAFSSAPTAPRPAATQASPGGLTYRAVNDRLSEAVRAKYAKGQDSWAWVRDFDDAMVVFEVEGDGEDLLAVGYTIDAEGVVTFTGEPTGVVQTFTPLGAQASAGSGSCGCRKTAAADGTGADLDAQVAELQDQVATLQAAVARLEAEGASVDDVADAPETGQ